MITGNTTKLRKMLKIADLRGDVMSQFQNAMFLGDAEKRTDSRKYRSTYISIHGGGIAWFDRRQRENRTSARGLSWPCPIWGKQEDRFCSLQLQSSVARTGLCFPLARALSRTCRLLLLAILLLVLLVTTCLQWPWMEMELRRMPRQLGGRRR